MTTFPRIQALLGEPRFNWTDPEPWDALERELGICFPADFRDVVDAYGSVVVNGQLYLMHPAGHLLRNLGEFVRKEIDFWREEDMVEYLPAPAGPGPGELLPVATATTGESVFLRVPEDPSLPWRVLVQEFDSPDWEVHEMTFGAWLLAYLRGEEVTLCVRNRAPDGPFYESLR